MAAYRIDFHEECRISGDIPPQFKRFFDERGIDLSPLDYWTRGVLEMSEPDGSELERMVRDWNEVDDGQFEARILFGPATGTERQIPVQFAAVPGGSSWQWD